MKKKLQFMVIDDEFSQIKIVRDGIKDYFKLTKEGVDKFLDDNSIVKVYSNDEVIVEIIQIQDPKIESIEKIIIQNNQNLVAIIFDMVWTHKEKAEFYDQQEGLFHQSFRDMMFRIEELYKTEYKNLPGGLRFLYKWFSAWKMKFDVPPVLVSKSVFFNDSLKKTLIKMGIQHFINKDEMQEEKGRGVLYTIQRIIVEYECRVEAKKIEATRFSASGRMIIPAQIKEDLLKFAKSSAKILLLGETGTGKSFLANFIHENSNRRNGPLEKINCGAIPGELMESTFFGHKKGSFTSAHNDHKGIFELADKGTLFLDEISSLPFVMQSKLLTVLDDGKFTKIGDEVTTQVDVRIIAATNEDPEDAIKVGKLRNDLYWRLNKLKINVPPLRDHKNDVLPLAEYFIEKHKGNYGLQFIQLAETAKEALLAYEWPGNIRELEGIIDKALALLENNSIITIRELGEEFRDLQNNSLHNTELNDLELGEKNTVLNCLTKSNWNKSKVSEKLGMTRPTLNKLIKKYGLKKEDYV